MQFRPIPFKILSSLPKTPSKHTIFEISKKSVCDRVLKGFSETFIREVEKQRRKGEPFVITTYALAGKKGYSHVFFPGSEDRFFEEAGKFLRTLSDDVTFVPTPEKDPLSRMDAMVLASYSFTTYKTEQKKKERRLSLVLEKGVFRAMQQTLQERAQLLSFVCFARDLVNTPSCDKTPEKLVAAISKLPWQRTEIEILRKADLSRLWFGCLLAVSSGSDAEPYVAIFRRKNAMKNAPTRAIIGKGVTFDAGGLQIKPEDSMHDMKSDMAWAAAVIATMAYLDNFSDLSENIIGAIGLTENLLGGSAMKPYDIVTARNGKTVEIRHTDAEGRLVLADVVAHIVETYAPDSVITIATLTGACVSALGYDYAGMIGDDAEMKKRISQISRSDGFENFYELPFDRHMKNATKGEISDYASMSMPMRAGASMGAAFIANFRGKSKYVHLDIAGPAFRETAYSVFPIAGTGFSVPTIAGLFRKTR